MSTSCRSSSGTSRVLALALLALVLWPSAACKEGEVLDSNITLADHLLPDEVGLYYDTATPDPAASIRAMPSVLAALHGQYPECADVLVTHTSVEPYPLASPPFGNNVVAAEGIANLFAVGSSSSTFGSLITLLSTQGSVHVLSSPRVSTVNNQKAVIKVGSDEFFDELERYR